MSNLSQFAGGSSILIGQSIEMQGSQPFITDNSKEYLKHGVLKAYESKYSAFKNRMPFASYIDVTPISGSGTTGYFANRHGVYYNGSVYMSLSFGSTGAAMKTTSDLVTWGAVQSTTFSNTPRDYAFGGATAVVVGTDTASGLRYATGPAWSTDSVHESLSVVACKPDGSLWVIVKYGHSITTANAIYTGSVGSWTNRTGTSSLSITPSGAVWVPCAAAFYFFEASSSGTSMLKTTNGYTFSTVWNNDPFVMNYPNGDYKKGIASSSTVTLILGVNGTLKRTTDGTTWTSIDLKTQNIPGVQSAREIHWNATTSKFYLHIGTETPGVAYMASSSDGITWSTMYAFRDDASLSGYTPWYLSYAGNVNGKTLFKAQDNTSYVISIMDATSDISQVDPDWIGRPSSESKVVRIY